MTRLASTAKAGFYPTPDRVTEWITRFVLPAESGGRLLDPCCGEGVAAQCVASAWNLEAYGIEIDADRALEASNRLHKALHLDYKQVRAPQHTFQALWLNAPYDYAAGEDRRTEYTFLRDTTKWLQPGGLLVYIVPQYRVDARMAGFLTTTYESIRAYRFPDIEYAQFKQVVIFGIAKAQPEKDEQSTLGLLQQCRGALAILPAEPPEAERYTLPVPAEGKFYFRGAEINPQEALAEAIEHGAWRTPEWREWLEPRRELAAFRPLMPLKKGHLAMLIAAGLMQNLLLEAEQGTEQLLVKGRTYKVQEQVESDDEDEEVMRDRFVTEIVALDLTTGEAARINEPAALAEFVEKWRDALAAKVMETFVPLYNFDLEAEGKEVSALLSRLSKHRCLPGRKETGLFPAQMHVAVALWERLQRARSAICVGEMGVGKSTIAAATAELLRQNERDNRPTLVLTPPHLVNKWIREIQQIVPMAFAMPLVRLGDVRRFFDQAARLNPGTPAFAVLSREMAKLGSGWQPAYWTRKQRRRVEDEDWDPEARAWRKTSRVETATQFACPRCGAEIVYPESGAPVLEAEYFSERKRRCPACGEPLYQATHFNAERRPPPADDPEPAPSLLSDSGDDLRSSVGGRTPTPRYPIADYIARRCKRRFRLLIADEVHQMKGQSTDQGYALGTLVRACDKTLALTGTIFGGRATSLFFLLHRLSPTVRAQFKWTDAQRWAERFGLLERVTKRDQGDSGYGTFSGKRRRQTYVRELPGASPELVTLLLDSTAFLSLSDLGFELPEYREHPHEIEMTKEQREAYDALENGLKDELQARFAEGDRSLLAAYLQSLLAYPNACFREEVVTDGTGEIVASAPALNGDGRPFPKEEWLVELARAERDRGRRVLVFCRQTATRDITERLVRILGRAGLRADVLKASVGTQVREEWLRRRVGKGMLDVLITNPKLVEVGLDLVAFQTTVWYEIDYSLVRRTTA